MTLHLRLDMSMEISNFILVLMYINGKPKTTCTFARHEAFHTPCWHGRLHTSICPFSHAFTDFMAEYCRDSTQNEHKRMQRRTRTNAVDEYVPHEVNV